MLSRVRHIFKGARLARMSDGTRCIVRDLGLVKGGKGLKHHETLMVLSLKGLTIDLPRQLTAVLEDGEQPALPRFSVPRWLTSLRRGRALEPAE